MEVLMMIFGGLGSLLLLPALMIVLKYSRLKARQMWTVGLPAVVAAGFLPPFIAGVCARSGVSLLPLFHPFSSTAILTRPEIGERAVVMASLLMFDSLFVGGICSWLLWVSKRRKEREQEERKLQVEHSIEQIKRDGVHLGPEKPYARHHEWGVGEDPHTPHETEPPRHKGYYNIPWP